MVNLWLGDPVRVSEVWGLELVRVMRGCRRLSHPDARAGIHA